MSEELEEEELEEAIKAWFDAIKRTEEAYKEYGRAVTAKDHAEDRLIGASPAPPQLGA